MDPVFEIKTISEIVKVYEDKIELSPKGLGKLNKGMFKGAKSIPFTAITAIQHKKVGRITSGYVQFTLAGGNESKGGILDATKDENTFMYVTKHKKVVTEIIDFIEKRRAELSSPGASTTPLSMADELKKLADLKEQGILTDEEFDTQKAKLLG